MGKSSEQFIEMREREYLISATFKTKGKYVNILENYLFDNTNLVNYKILTDFKELYDNDVIFRKLVKMEAEAKKQKEIYINNKL
tara:strand:- start:4424 stop:4675 length:252 start_codon:yes stop_codon:yes gene_type:complete